jgi:hypothetical protein
VRRHGSRQNGVTSGFPTLSGTQKSWILVLPVGWLAGPHRALIAWVKRAAPCSSRWFLSARNNSGPKASLGERILKSNLLKLRCRCQQNVGKADPTLLRATIASSLQTGCCEERYDERGISEPRSIGATGTSPLKIGNLKRHWFHALQKRASKPPLN